MSGTTKAKIHTTITKLKIMKNRILTILLGFLLLSVLSCQKEADLTANSKEELEEKLKL
jgi:hypothetical protein